MPRYTKKGLLARLEKERAELEAFAPSTDGRRVVRLTAMEREAADMSGLSMQEYARSKVSLWTEWIQKTEGLIEAKAWQRKKKKKKKRATNGNS